MVLDRIPTSTAFLFVFLILGVSVASAQKRENLPKEYREYTNPDEVVTFKRTTPFQSAIDVISDFAQKYRNKVVVNQTSFKGDIGVNVPPMHWMDALQLILQVNNLVLLEQDKFFEIVTEKSQTDKTGKVAAADTTGEGPIATTKTHEVRINAIFFEGNRRALQEIGVDWSTISQNVPDAILSGGQNQGGSGGSGGSSGGGGGQQQQGAQIPNSQFDGPFVQVNSRGAQNVSQNVFDALINLGEVGNTGIRVQALFSAFEADNLGEILASPTIKVMEGQQGRIQVGQDFSIKQRTIAGNVTEQFFSVGTILEVTPTVIDQNDTTFVHLDINAERSTAQPDPVSTIINKTQATTEALLIDGEATVIAGLYSTEQNEVRRGIPILKDLPPWFFGLRYLFGYNSKDTQMRELVVLLQVSLEPRISDRYGNEVREKFEVLRDERQEMREDIRSSQKAKELESSPEMQKLNANSSDKKEEQRSKKREEEQKKQMPPKREQTKEDTTEVKKQVDNQPTTIKDPEIKTKEVKLNLGSEDTTKSSETGKEQLDRSYYVIGGAFRNEANARDYRNKLEDLGYEAKLLPNVNKDGWQFVAYGEYSTLSAAQTALSRIKEQNPEAWLYNPRN